MLQMEFLLMSVESYYTVTDNKVYAGYVILSREVWEFEQRNYTITELY